MLTRVGSRMLMALAGCLLVSTATAAEWQLKRQEAGIEVYQQPTPSGYAITRGSREVEASLPVLMNVLRDAGVCVQLIFSCRSGRVAETYSQTERLDYVVIDAPLLLDDRDIYIHSSSTYDAANKTVLIRLAGRENHDAGQPGKVRVKGLAGFWRFQQTSPDKAMVTYQIYSDPQIPGGSFFSGVLEESVFYTLENLAKLVKLEKYQTTESIEAMM